MKSLEKLDDGTPIVVVPMENEGMSYGQYCRMLRQFPDDDYYILMEDDYVPVQDDFDKILVELLDKVGCDYLCGVLFNSAARFGKRRETHAAVSNGIAKGSVLRSIYEQQGCLMPRGSSYNNCQIIFSRSFLKHGFNIEDWTEHYQTKYLGTHELRVFGDEAPDLINPIQCLKKEYDEVRLPRRRGTTVLAQSLRWLRLTESQILLCQTKSGDP